VVMVSSKVEEVDRVLSFELGADDYITKPFSVREMVLRVRAVLRRAGAIAPVAGLERRHERAAIPERRPKAVGPIHVDPDAHRARLDATELALTLHEFRLFVGSRD